MSPTMFKDDVRSSSSLKHRPAVRTSIALLLLLIASAGMGCSSNQTSLQFYSQKSDARYTQEFRRASFKTSDIGEYDLVLVEDGFVSQARSRGPLVTASEAPLNQMVHIRIQWRPERGAKPDAPSATNALIDWYVRANDPNVREDFLHYRGAGFVGIYGSGDTMRFALRSGHLELASHSGHLQDPLGPCSLEGSIVATRNDGQVTAALNLLNEQSAERTPVPANGFVGPPPRAPSGP